VGVPAQLGKDLAEGSHQVVANGEIDVVGAPHIDLQDLERKTP
jgi:hypothetical protein